MSILVRMMNEAARLPEFLESLEAQKVNFPYEIIFLDSGSTDASLDIANAVGGDVSIYSISSREFNFSTTCNLLVDLALGDVFVMFSAHVVLQSHDLLQKTFDALKAEYSAVGFRQVENKSSGSSAYELLFLKRTFPAADNIAPLAAGGAFSNAGAAFTRAAFNLARFPQVPASEDFLWATSVSRLGARIGYAGNLSIAHSHNESPNQLQRRVRLNKIARFGGRSMPLRSAVYFFGLLILLSMHGAGPKDSWRYAVAHAKAYL